MWRPSWPTRPLRGLPDGPRAPLHSPRGLQDGLQKGPQATTTAQDGPKTAPRELQDGPIGTPEAPKRAPRWLRDGPNRAPGTDLAQRPLRDPPGNLLDPSWDPRGPPGERYSARVLRHLHTSSCSFPLLRLALLRSCVLADPFTGSAEPAVRPLQSSKSGQLRTTT